MENYTFVKSLAPTIVGLSHEEYGNQLWNSVTLRKDARCADCGVSIPKSTKAFSPVTNGYNRMHRLCTLCVRDMERRAAK